MSPIPKVVSQPKEIYSVVRAAQKSSLRVGVVPTMGALHQGHLSLVAAAGEACDVTVVTIFVNPTQFGPGEDFDKYPRTLTEDCEKLADIGADYVFAPASDEVYRPGHSTYIDPPAASLPLEGEHRPGHFRGVATIVLKLFQMIPADVAYFGQKDYQQLLVIRQMVADLNVPIEIEMCPTVRESDGLAMSSRNAYLSDEERTRATAISRALERARSLREQGEKSASPILGAMRRILNSGGIDAVDYVAIADAESLKPMEEIDGKAIALIAAHVGETRLIDNMFI